MGPETGTQAAPAAAENATVDISTMSDEEVLEMPDAPAEAPVTDPATPAEKPAETDPAKPDDAAISAEAAKPEIDAQGRDWRRVPHDIREVLRGNEKLASLYFEHGAFKAAFPDVKTAETVAKDIAELGGVENLPEVMTELKQSRELDSAYYGDDSAAKVASAEAMVRDNPQAFEQFFRAGAQAIANFNPRAYEAIVNELLPSALAAHGFDAIFDFAQRVVDAKSGEAAMQLAEHLLGARDQLGMGAKKAASQPDPASALQKQRAEIDRRTQEADARDAKNFWSGTEKSIDTAVVDQIADAVKGALPEGIQPGAVAKIVRDIRNDLSVELQKDTEATKQITDLVKRQGLNDETAARIQTITLKSAKGLLPEVAKRVIDEWTTSVISINRARVDAHGKAAHKTDVGTGPGSSASTPSKFTRGKVNYDTTSDEDLIA